jgi:uncharacterized protein YdeI (YjbR/CyaY-like superfamily)
MIKIERNDKPRTVTVPLLMKKALAANPQAKAIFEKLPPSHRREHVKWITEAKQEATVQRRLEKLVPMLLKKSAAKK